MTPEFSHPLTGDRNVPGPAPPVSVVLVAYHGDRWLPACIASLAEASTRRLHLVLVDNSGNTGLDRLDLGRFDAEVVRTPRPMGFAEANNYALVHAARLADAVLFLNQDTVSPPGWIDRCLACFAQEARLGAVSPCIRTYDGTGWDPSFLTCVPPGIDPARPAGEGPDWFYAPTAPAPALLVRTSALLEAGPFDPVFGSYYEDYDLCLRLRRCGYRIGFCRSARIHHFSGSTTTTRARELRRMRQLIRNRVIYGLREAEGPRLPRVLRYGLADLPRRLVRGLLRTPSSQPPAVTLKAYGDLLRIAGRLASRRRDERAWRRYLGEIGWAQRTAPAERRRPPARLGPVPAARDGAPHPSDTASI